MIMARVRWVVPGGNDGVCILVNVTANGIAARKIFALLKTRCPRPRRQGAVSFLGAWHNRATFAQNML